LTEEVSAIHQKKLPQKLKDPDSFTIPCEIGGVHVRKSLCDLGASINLMPLSLLKKLGVNEVKQAMVTLQMADRSIKRPYGVVEDLLVKVEKFIFPFDFVVMDMEASEEVPIILGRPFLATGRTLNDMEGGALLLRVHEEKVTFKVLESWKNNNDNSSCMNVEVVDTSLAQELNKINHDSAPKIKSSFCEKPNEKNEVSHEKSKCIANERSKTCPLEKLPYKKASKVENSASEKPLNTPQQSFSNFHCIFMDSSCTLPVIFHNSIGGKLEEI
jgi:hypothetical protein